MTMFVTALGILIGLASVGSAIVIVWAVVVVTRGIDAMARPPEPKDPHPERHAAAVSLARRSPWMVEHAREIIDAYHEHYGAVDFDRWVNLVAQVGLESATELAAQMDATGFANAYKIADRYGGVAHVIPTDETSQP